MRHGGLAVGRHSALDACRVFLRDGRVDDAFILRRMPFYHRLIRPDEIGRVEQRLQPMLHVRILRHDHQSARALVQPVDRSIHKIRRTAQMGIQRIFQRIIRMLYAGLACQRRRLVNHIQVLILIDDVQRQMVRLQLINRLIVPEGNRQRLSCKDELVYSGNLPVKRNSSIPFGGLYRRAAYAHALPKDALHPHAVLLRQYHMFQLIHP